MLFGGGRGFDFSSLELGNGYGYGYDMVNVFGWLVGWLG